MGRRLTGWDILKIKELHALGLGSKAIAKRVGCVESTVRDNLRRQGVPPVHKKPVRPPDPTPEEIEKRKAEIRKRNLREMRDG